jgi:hypothetical protein
MQGFKGRGNSTNAEGEGEEGPKWMSRLFAAPTVLWVITSWPCCLAQEVGLPGVWTYSEPRETRVQMLLPQVRRVEPGSVSQHASS